MLTIYGTVYPFLYVVVVSALLIVGLIQCKKHSFSGGFYFFLLLIVGKVYSFLLSFAISPILKHYFDSIDPSTHRPFGMTMGELIAWISYANLTITHTIEIIAFSFLVVGLYRMWKSKMPVI